MTVSAEIFDQTKMTAAHKTLPMGSVVAVHRTDTQDGPTVIVRINDRGPYINGRIIDLSRAAAEHLDIVTDGFAPVEIVMLPNYKPTPFNEPLPPEPEKAKKGKAMDILKKANKIRNQIPGL